MSRSDKPRRSLSIDTKSADPHEESFIANGDVFIKDNVAINSTGIAMRNNPKRFSLMYEDLRIGEMIGRGKAALFKYLQRIINKWQCGNNIVVYTVCINVSYFCTN